MGQQVDQSVTGDDEEEKTSSEIYRNSNLVSPNTTRVPLGSATACFFVYLLSLTFVLLNNLF
jgi:hypothetical protein